MAIEHLARAVLCQAICDARLQSTRGEMARGWMRAGNSDFRFWCDVADIAPEFVVSAIRARRR
jgi:hypothetical protein